MIPKNVNILENEYKLKLISIEKHFHCIYEVIYKIEETNEDEIGFERMLKDLEKIYFINKLSIEQRDRINNEIDGYKVMQKLTEDV